FIIVHSHPRIPFRVGQSDIQRTIFAAIVDDDILKVLIRLSQHTFNTLCQIGLAIVHGRHHAHQWLFTHNHLFTSVSSRHTGRLPRDTQPHCVSFLFSSTRAPPS